MYIIYSVIHIHLWIHWFSEFVIGLQKVCKEIFFVETFLSGSLCMSVGKVSHSRNPL